MKINSKAWAYTLVISIIGLIADVITILSLNLIERKSSYSAFEIFLHSKINQQVIWFIALFAYIGLIKIYKDERKNIPRYPLYFFIIKSPFLIIPFVIIPFVILFGLLIHIWGKDILWFIIPIALPTFLFLNDHMPQDSLHEIIKENELREPTSRDKKIIENNWESISNRVDLETKRSQWISFSHLEDLKDVYGISSYGVKFLLKKYSVEKPEKVKFVRSLYIEREGGYYEIEREILISLDNIEDKYMF